MRERRPPLSGKKEWVQCELVFTELGWCRRPQAAFKNVIWPFIVGLLSPERLQVLLPLQHHFMLYHIMRLYHTKPASHSLGALATMPLVGLTIAAAEGEVAEGGRALSNSSHKPILSLQKILFSLRHFDNCTAFV
jgi:hypothetical protein